MSIEQAVVFAIAIFLLGVVAIFVCGPRWFSDLGKVRVHDSEHWTNGGTGITNFGGIRLYRTDEEEFARYCEAVRAFGDKRFVVSSTCMLGRGRDMEGGSLHFLGDVREEGTLTAFWQTFDAVTQGLAL